MIDLDAMQAALREAGLDGWLMFDFRASNVLARRILQIDPHQHSSRRWFYFVPADGPPVKLVHRIESGALDHLPGEKQVYLKWQELEEGVQRLVAGSSTIAMEYSPRGGNPYVSRVDAGTVELVRSFGVEIVSSGDLVQQFEATWDDEQWQLHLQADAVTQAAFEKAWGFIAERIRDGVETRETDVQQVILDHFKASGVLTDHAPIVGVGPHSGDPHYSPVEGADSAMHEGGFVLIDLWAKVDHPRGVYSDLTRTGFIGRTVPDEFTRIFEIVAAARDAAIDCVRTAFAEGRPLQGWQVDKATRDVIEAAGYGEAFRHRTGHSIGRETHGNGANMDNLETHEERTVMRRTCFSVEPGIYLPEFGVRSEVDVFVDADGEVHVTGGPLQTAVVAVLAEY